MREIVGQVRHLGIGYIGSFGELLGRLRASLVGRRWACSGVVGEGIGSVYDLLEGVCPALRSIDR